MHEFNRADTKAMVMCLISRSIEADLAKAIDGLLGREGRLERCIAVMQINVPKALLWQRIKAVAPT